MSKFPDDEADFRLNWSVQGATVAVLGEMVGKVNSKAAMAFTRKQDDIAHAMRELAGEIESRQKEESKLLHEYIAEDQRRDFEFRSKVKAPRTKFEMKREGGRSDG